MTYMANKERTTAVNTVKKVRGKPFLAGQDTRRNKTGRPRGVLNYETKMKLALEKIAAERGVSAEDLEIQLFMLGFKMAEQDVFVNVAGGIRILETAPDLAITMAIASSFRDQPIQKDTIHIGEVGLGGEVRMVSQLEKRLTEAARLGFKCAIIPHHSSLTRLRSIGIQLKPVANVLEAMRESLAATV